MKTIAREIHDIKEALYGEGMSTWADHDVAWALAEARSLVRELSAEASGRGLS